MRKDSCWHKISLLLNSSLELTTSVCVEVIWCQSKACFLGLSLRPVFMQLHCVCSSEGGLSRSSSRFGDHLGVGFPGEKHREADPTNPHLPTTYRDKYANSLNCSQSTFYTHYSHLNKKTKAAQGETFPERRGCTRKAGRGRWSQQASG